jgi:hypothetical protein
LEAAHAFGGESLHFKGESFLLLQQLLLEGDEGLSVDS